MFQNREVRACIRSMTSELWVQQVAQTVLSSFPTPQATTPATNSINSWMPSTGLAPACSFCRLSLHKEALWYQKEIGDGELTRRNQSIPSKKLLAGQDSCPVWTKRRDSRSHEMPWSCHTGQSASECAVHM